MSKMYLKSRELKPNEEKTIEIPVSAAAHLVKALENLQTSQDTLGPKDTSRRSSSFKQRPRYSKSRTSAGKATVSSIGQLVGLLPVPCKYSEEGCDKRLDCSEMKEHEQECRFRPGSCPYIRPKCTWKGPLCHMVDHIRDKHDVDLYRGEQVPVTTKDFSGGWKSREMWFQQCFGEHFLVLLVSPRSDCTKATHLLVQLIGGPEDARRFTYRVHLELDDRSISWTGQPLSIEDSVSTAIGAEAECLIFDSWAFTTNRGKLDIVITIYKGD